MRKILSLVLFVCWINPIFAANYPPNEDYGSEGDFLAKRGTERGRTAILGTVGPLLVNLPEAPGSSSRGGVELQVKDTVWDLSNLRNPELIREVVRCEGCNGAGQPINAHGTVTRFREDESYIYVGGNLEVDSFLRYDPEGVDSNAQAVSTRLQNWGNNPLNYSMMFSPYYARNFWNYNNDPGGEIIIRNPDRRLHLGDLNYERDTAFLGEHQVAWDHLSNDFSRGVTGFASWLGNLFVVASDQRGTGIAIYDISGFKEGITPRLLSTYQPPLTEPDGNPTGIGGYWVEPYGTNKMVWAARRRTISPIRHFPAMYIVDFTNPMEPKLTCEIYFNQDSSDPADGDDSSDPMYVNFQDQYAYVDHFRVDIDLCEEAYAKDGEISDQKFDEIVYRFNDIENGCEASQYFRPLGQVGIFGGYDYFGTRTEIQYSSTDGSVMELGRFHLRLGLGEGIFQGFRPFASKGDDRIVGPRINGLAVGDVYLNTRTQQEYTITGFDTGEVTNEQGMCFMVTSDEPDTRAPYVSGHRPLNGQTNYPIDGYIHFHIPETLRTETAANAVTVSQLGESGEVVAEIPFRQQLTHTGTMAIWPDSEFSVDVTYRVDIVGIEDYMGNTMQPYSFSFTTGDEIVEGPDVPVDLGPAPTYSGTPYYPNQSSQLSCSPESEDDNLWVVNPDNDSVTVIDTNLDETTKRLSASVTEELFLNYQNPTSVTKIGEFYAITFRHDDKVVFYNAQTKAPAFSVDTGHGTQPIASVTDGSALYVSLYGASEVVKIDPIKRIIESRLSVGPTPKAMAMTGDRLLVTRQISATDYAEVYDINTNGSMSLTRTIRVNKITIPDDLTNGSGVPNLLSSIVISSNGEEAFVTAVKANTDRGLVRNGVPLDDDNTVRPMLITLDLVNNRDANLDPSTSDGTSDFDNSADPFGVTFLVNGIDRVTSLQGNNLIRIDNEGANTGHLFQAGFAPQDMCTTLRMVYVKDFTGRTVSAVDVAEYLDNGSITSQVVTINTVSDELMSDEALRGKQVFYHSSTPEMGREGYISCASCHLDGGSDGRVWDITALGEGLRNTLSLNGTKGTRFGNLHWSGNFDEVQDFELQIEKLNGGEGLIMGETFDDESPLDVVTSGRSSDLDALAAYVESLGKKSVSRSPERTYIGELSPSAIRGQQQFTDRGCASCHKGAAFRDGLSHDVGTITSDSGSRLGAQLASIRTPSLIELWQSAPYFHDGSAATLNDVFDRGTEHSQSFSGSEEVDLIEFLKSIDREMYIEDDEIFNPG